MRSWLSDLLSTHKELEQIGGLLSPMPYDDSAQMRVSVKKAYRDALGTVRSAEFYFRTPPEIQQDRTPSVKVAAAKFQRKVSSAPVITGVGSWSYQDTRRDLERKESLYFSRTGSFLPDRSLPRTFFGLEQTSVVKERFRAPHLIGVG